MPDRPIISVDSDGLVITAAEATDIASQLRQQQAIALTKLLVEKLTDTPIFDGGQWTP